ncbi:hypothetical protein D3C80_1969390 [compost metagenome]
MNHTVQQAVLVDVETDSTIFRMRVDDDVLQVHLLLQRRIVLEQPIVATHPLTKPIEGVFLFELVHVDHAIEHVVNQLGAKRTVHSIPSRDRVWRSRRLLR